MTTKPDIKLSEINEVRKKQLLKLLQKDLKKYIIEKGYWKDNQIITKELMDKTIESLDEKICEKEMFLFTHNELVKKTKQICNHKIKQQLDATNTIKDINQMLVTNIEDTEKINQIIKSKMQKID